MDRLVRFRLSRRVFYDNPMFPLRFVRVGGRERGRVWTKWGGTRCTSPFAFKRCAKTELSKAHFCDVFPIFRQRMQKYARNFMFSQFFFGTT